MSYLWESDDGRQVCITCGSSLHGNGEKHVVISSTIRVCHEIRPMSREAWQKELQDLAELDAAYQIAVERDSILTFREMKAAAQALEEAMTDR